MTARAKPDPLGVECPYCSAVALTECFRYDRRSGGRWGYRAPHAARVRRAESAEQREKRGDAGVEAAEALTVYCDVCEADRREPCHTVTTGDPAPYPHPERAVAAAQAQEKKEVPGGNV